MSMTILPHKREFIRSCYGAAIATEGMTDVGSLPVRGVRGECDGAHADIEEFSLAHRVEHEWRVYLLRSGGVLSRNAF